ncbi:unnamed protein product [Microthlaspi erraticum]|uniref:Uncharacterized protein n=1 Tax=Microthlaspi erraticum TaxID=1685480 RepID=A0A6D2K117_9BRAS|nr:unnamed protein product [Microthlaspi erraticum]
MLHGKHVPSDSGHVHGVVFQEGVGQVVKVVDRLRIVVLLPCHGEAERCQPLFGIFFNGVGIDLESNSGVQADLADLAGERALLGIGKCFCQLWG